MCPSFRSSLPALLTVAGMTVAGHAQALSYAPVYLMQDSSALGTLAETARSQNRLMMGTFHDRLGDQTILNGDGFAASAWVRGFGEHVNEDRAGRFSPEFRGDTGGMQAGIDLFAHDWGNGHRDRFGVFAGYADTHGDVDDLRGTHARVSLDGVSFGGYWTHVGPGGWYVDAVLAGSWGDAKVSTNVGRVHSDADTFAGSIEAGYPIALNSKITLEPQVQMIAQHTDLDSIAMSPGLPYASFDAANAVTGRAGMRLQARFDAAGVALMPYGVANLWHEFSSSDRMTLLWNTASAKQGGTDLELRAGMVAQFSNTISAYANVGYATNLDSRDYSAVRGTIGVRFGW